MLYPDGTWKCFACTDGHGDVIDLFRVGEALTDRRDACRIMASQFLTPGESDEPRIDVPRRPDRQPNLNQAPNSEVAIPSWAISILATAHNAYRTALAHEPSILHYLRTKRGLSDATMARLQLGYADGHSLIPALRRAGEPAAVSNAEQMGLLSPTGRGEFFRQRILFPILNAAAEPTYLIGRATLPDQEPKYLNLPDTGILHRQPMLWGESKRGVIVVEGPMDLAAPLQWGFDQDYLLVTLLGVGYEAVLQHLLARCNGAVPIYVLLDQDNAGKRAALRLAEALIEVGFDCVFIVVDRDRFASARRVSFQLGAVVQPSEEQSQQLAQANQHLELVTQCIERGLITGVNWCRAKDPGELLLFADGEARFRQAVAKTP
jgi:DNA primase